MPKQKLRSELATNLVSFLSAGFGLAAALAWNDALTLFMQRFIDIEQTVMGRLIYAGVLTIFLVVLLTVVARIVRTVAK